MGERLLEGINIIQIHGDYLTGVVYNGESGGRIYAPLRVNRRERAA